MTEGALLYPLHEGCGTPYRNPMAHPYPHTVRPRPMPLGGFPPLEGGVPFANPLEATLFLHGPSKTAGTQKCPLLEDCAVTKLLVASPQPVVRLAPQWPVYSLIRRMLGFS